MIGKDSLWCKLLADVALSYPLYINTINTRPGRLKGEGSFSTAEGGVSTPGREAVLPDRFCGSGCHHLCSHHYVVARTKLG